MKAKFRFSNFPSEPILLQKWIKAVDIKNWTPTSSSSICQLHFENTDFTNTATKKRLKPDVVPIQNLCQSCENNKQACNIDSFDFNEAECSTSNVITNTNSAVSKADNITRRVTTQIDNTISRYFHRFHSFAKMQPKLELIAAACEKMGIGINGNLPWRLKSEMAFFTRMTTETKDKNKKNVVLMGRRTWDCIPDKFRPLKDRINMVLTTQELDYGDKAITCKSIPHALEVIMRMQAQVERVWVIGGSSVYEAAMKSPHFGRLYLTRINKDFQCDTFFPSIPSDFALIKDPTVPQGTQEEKDIKFVYEVYERR